MNILKSEISNGYFAFNQKSGMVTATQVEADDRRTLETVKAFRDILDGKNHNGVIHRIAYILYVTALASGETAATDFSINCFFGDLTENFEEDRNRAYQMMIQGVIPKWFYLHKYEGYTEEAAKELVEEASQKAPGLFDEE